MLRVPNTALWAVLRPLLRLILRLRLHFRAARVRMKGPYVLVGNHASWYDPLLAAVCADRPLCFCGADPAPRAGLLLSLARSLRQPDELNWKTALKEAGESGCCLGLFPEGERCIDGVTGPIPGELAAEIQKSGLGLVVLRLEGGYLTAPRWAEQIPRRGRLRARVMHTLTPGVLKAMETDELQELIENGLREDAFETAKRHPAPFRGKATAERLEKLLCVCPKCGAVGTMQSRDNEFLCRGCGFTTVYTLGGGFRGGKVPFADLREWELWQTGKIRQLCEKAEDGPIFEDEGYEIYTVHGSVSDRIGIGGLHLYRDRLELPTGIAIASEDVAEIELSGSSGLRIMSRRGSRFELKTIRPICAEKYITALAVLKVLNRRRPEKPAPKREEPEKKQPEETAPAEETRNGAGDPIPAETSETTTPEAAAEPVPEEEEA